MGGPLIKIATCHANPIEIARSINHQANEGAAPARSTIEAAEYVLTPMPVCRQFKDNPCLFCPPFAVAPYKLPDRSKTRLPYGFSPRGLFAKLCRIFSFGEPHMVVTNRMRKTITLQILGGVLMLMFTSISLIRERTIS